MRLLARATFITGLICWAAATASAQAAQAPGTNTVTGRVTVNDKPAQGVAVVLLPMSAYGPPERKAVARATTDEDGRFRLTNIAAGRYQVMPITPTFVVPGRSSSFREHARNVSLMDGETIEGIDFALVRGGVITGRVTDADGRPVIGENVRLALAGQSNNQRGAFFFNPFMYQTDDRGVYRIFGLQPDRYIVSVGEDSNEGTSRMGFGRSRFYTRTYHPGVTDAAKAGVLEVTEGGEATNVDITLGRPTATYSASGIVVDAETGKPVQNFNVGFGTRAEGERQMNSYSVGIRSDAEGRFRIEGLLPGRYAAFAFASEQNDSYSVPVPFELSEGDVTGLVIKVRRGVSLSGVVVIEGANDRAALAKLSQLRVDYSPISDGLATPSFENAERVNPDGSFILRGLRPGKVQLRLGGWPPMKGFSLLRVERDGVEQREGIVEVAAGAQPPSVRLVVEYGSGILRGQVQIENGTLPGDARLYVTARRLNVAADNLPGAEVDARGRFLLEGLPTGEYQLRAGGRLSQSGQRLQSATQNVQVTNGAETQVTLVIDLKGKGGAPDDKQ
jgi:hypothetical protein